MGGGLADAVSAEHPGSIGRRKVFPKSTIDDDDIMDSHRSDLLTSGGRQIRDLLLHFGSAGEQSLSHLDVTRHSDTLVTLQRFAK
jgi:hypothetical protein